MREAKPQWKAVLRRTGSPVAIAFLGVLMASAPLSGARGETLAEALAMAYRNNPNIEAQRAFLRATDEGVAQALSGWRPRVQIDATEIGRASCRERVCQYV